MSIRLASLAMRASRRAWGETATLVHGGQTLTIKGEFDDACVREDIETGTLQDTGPRFALSSDVIDGLTIEENTDTLTVRGVTYIVREVRPDGLGGLLLILRVQED